MRCRLDWPDVDNRGLVEVTLSRRDLRALLHALNTRAYGQPGIISVDDDLVVLVGVEEDADHAAGSDADLDSWEAREAGYRGDV